MSLKLNSNKNMCNIIGSLKYVTILSTINLYTTYKSISIVIIICCILSSNYTSYNNTTIHICNTIYVPDRERKANNLNDCKAYRIYHDLVKTREKTDAYDSVLDANSGVDVVSICLKIFRKENLNGKKECLCMINASYELPSGKSLEEPDRRLLSINEVRQILKINYQKAKKLVLDNRLKSVNIDGKNKVPMFRLDEFLMQETSATHQNEINLDEGSNKSLKDRIDLIIKKHRS